MNRLQNLGPWDKMGVNVDLRRFTCEKLDSTSHATFNLEQFMPSAHAMLESNPAAQRAESGTLSTHVIAAAKPHRIDFLDSIRGLAASSVVAAHYVGIYGLPRWQYALTFTPLHILWDGYAAVSLFFVLSGFVLSIRHFRTTAQPDLRTFQIKSYAIARIFRIWLPYLVVLAISALAWRFNALAFNTSPQATGEFPHALWQVRPTLAGVLRQANLMSWNPLDLVPQAWTLAVELIISLCVPFGVLLASRSPVWLLVFTIYSMVFFHVSGFTFHFALGICIAQRYEPLVTWLRGHGLGKCALWIIGLLLYTSRHHHLLPFYRFPTFDWVITGMGAAMLLLAAATTPLAVKFLLLTPIHALGRTSYSIYLIHFAVLICLTPRILLCLNRCHLGAAWYLGLVCTGLAVILLSEITYRSIEVGSMRLGKWLSAKV